ncbi:hypothetical protein [Candidatus Nitrosotenuis cloacae]|uniref:hypothetical protein n=1 Tax=Candidatus Nitrosotenuis cloacae TaxID=1603555 RepID=UPI00227DD220|nr:hypothetical protein [Candidatus Nitrosotenuis cloacae]
MLSNSFLYNFKLALAISLCFTLITIPYTSSYGERLIDQYGNKVTVSAEITNVKINYRGGFADFNDPGGFATGEVAVLYSFSEPGHANMLETELNLDGWDLQLHDSVPTGAASRYRQSINQQLADHTKYSHTECHPLGTLNTVFTVYNVNGRWPNWEGILVDTAKAASFATLRQLAIEVGYVAAEGATMGGLLVAAVGAVIVQNIIYTIRGNESLGVGTMEIDLTELGENGEQTYTVTTQATTYGSAEITFVVRTSTEDIPCSEVASSQTGVHGGELYAMLDDSFQTVPGWVKQNAEWWADGTISDRDFASGIAFLVKEGIISADVPVDNDGTIMISDSLQIPDWIRNNARWWADGTITDSDFTSGIEYMVDSKIISFSAPVKSDLAKSNFEALYVISKRSESISSSLYEINKYQKEVFGDAVDSAWDRYDSTKSKSDLDDAQMYAGKVKGIEQRLQALSKTQSMAEQNTKGLVKTAEKNGISKVALEKAAAGKAFSKIRLDSSQKLAQALKDAENANKQNAKDLEKTLKLPQGAILDSLLWNADESGKSVDSKKLDPIFENNRRFFEDYYSVPDHLPIKAVFVDNWTALVDTHRDAQDKGTEPVETKPDTEHEAIPDATQPAEPIEETGRQVAVLVINGKYYPLSQFAEVPAHAPNCDAIHYHSEFQSVYSTDGAALSDPSPSTCGFGKIGLIPVNVVTMTPEQVDAFAEQMGFEP